MRFQIMVLIVAIAAFFTFLRPGSSQSKSQSRTSVSIDDIPQRVQIIGCLGKPLGEAVNVTGKWEDPPGPAKDASLRFNVLSVNGVKPEKSVWFPIGNVNRGSLKREIEPKNGDIWELIAVEELEFRAHDSLRQATGIGSMQDPYDGWQKTLRGTFKDKAEERKQRNLQEQENVNRGARTARPIPK